MSAPTFPRHGLRRRTARGAVLTGVLLIVTDIVVLAQGLVVTRLLGPSAIGLYGIASAAAVAVIALKKVGIDEAFVAQEVDDEAREFQLAFTLDFALAVIAALVICALAPLIGAVWHDDRLVLLVVSLSYLPVAIALQAPTWIFFRRMDYGRQRGLQAVQPAAALVVTVALAVAGAGVWSMVIGQATGYAAAILVGLRLSPYRLKLRFDRRVARRYVLFSAPILVATAATVVILQGQTLVFKLHDGLAAVGFITLAVTLTRYVDRADQVVTSSLYPAICAIRGQSRLLEELFVKSNRATLLWVLPFSTGVVLFAPDVQHFILGSRWQPAVVLVQGMAVATAIGQLGFNWFSFFRAHGDNRPVAIEATIGAAGFLCLAVPGLLVDGVYGFLAGRIGGVIIVAAVRRHFVGRLLPGVRYVALVRPALLPIAIACAGTLGVRLVEWGSGRRLGEAVLELITFAVLYAASVLCSERQLITELVAAVR